ncbi:hypothetical protein I5U65_14625 [Stenotrophomonas maltophilia]|nr:hypothetical protein [Stenotrophomonas maltophilia]
MNIWIVGQFKAETEHGSVWDFQGAFATREEAIAACRTSQYFIAPCEVGKEIQDETLDFPAVEYPIAQESAAG